jgi:thioredoxin 1
MKTKILSLILVLSLASIPFWLNGKSHESPEQNQRDELVAEIIDLTFIELPGVDTAIDGVLFHFLESAGKTADIPLLVEKFKEEAGKGEAYKTLAEPYINNFSDEDLLYVRNLYQSPSYQKYLSQQPKIGQSQMLVMQELVIDLVEKYGTSKVDEPKDTELAEVNEDSFEECVINSDVPVILDIYSQSCPPCKRLKPVLEELQAELSPQYSFVCLDGEASSSLTKKLNVRGYPTLLFYKNGKVVGKHVGYLPADALREKIQEAFAE